MESCDIGACQHFFFEDKGLCVCELCGYELTSQLSFEKVWKNTTPFNPQFFLLNKQSTSQLSCTPTTCSQGSIARFEDQHDDSGSSVCAQERLQKQRSTIQEFDSVGDDYPPAVIARANEMYQLSFQEKSKIRKQDRKSILVACLFYAFREQNEYRDILSIQKRFGVSRQSMSKAMKFLGILYAKNQIGTKSYVTVEDEIAYILTVINKKESINEAKAFYQTNFLKRNSESTTLRCRPKSIAAAVVWCSLLRDANLYSMKDFASMIDLSEVTILKVIKENRIIKQR